MSQAGTQCLRRDLGNSLAQLARLGPEFQQLRLVERRQVRLLAAELPTGEAPDKVVPRRQTCGQAHAGAEEEGQFTALGQPSDPLRLKLKWF
ncbi:hypothetical protein ASD81_04200 [Nocardioides sp. Root614]|nr:hypothetical protein ASD81_04200 [Nocardioides sp. Root614]KRA91853.1 hypothetical protein ASD84_04465 [Nocardioides sp. Root682]